MISILHELLELDVLKRGGARVVAGGPYLGRTVRWVHVTERPDIAHLLEGRELITSYCPGISRGDEPS